MNTKYQLVNGEDRIPFSDFLKAEKERRNLTWVEMGELCGVNRIEAYVLNASGGTPNNPKIEAFYKIIDALGREEDDFEINESVRSVQAGSDEYWEVVRHIGDSILEKNEELLHL